MPRDRPLGRREVREQFVGLWALQPDRLQAPAAIPPQQDCEQPLAEAAVRVIEDRPAVFGIHSLQARRARLRDLRPAPASPARSVAAGLDTRARAETA